MATLSVFRALGRSPISCASSTVRNVASVFNVSTSHARTYYPTMELGNESKRTRSTTILCVRKDNLAVMIGDGQVTHGDMVVKPNARKIRRVSKDKVIVGCAGSVADAFTLIDRLETKLDECGGKLQRACIELAKAWRTDRYLRHLQASLIAVDKEVMLHIGGAGDIMESHDNVLATGSGMYFALPAARALLENCPHMSAEEVALKAMILAGDMCVYTNKNFTIEKIEMVPTTRPSIDEESTKTSKEDKKPKEDGKKDKKEDDDDSD